MNNKLVNRQSGFSLVETIVAIGLFGIAGVGALTLMNLYSASTTKLAETGNGYDLRQYVANSLSCTNILANAANQEACNTPGGAPIDVFDSAGNILISKTDGATNLFDNKMRSRCVANGGTYALPVDYMEVTKSGGVLKDVFSGQAKSWKSLSNGIPWVCQPTGCAGGVPTFRFAFGQDADGLDVGSPDKAGVCPDGQVAVATHDAPIRLPNVVCCELSATGVFVGAPFKVTQPALCPPDSVVTGVNDLAEAVINVKGDPGTYFCRRIDTTRFKLSTPTVKGFWFGEHDSHHGAGSLPKWKPLTLVTATIGDNLPPFYDALRTNIHDICLPEDPNEVIQSVSILEGPGKPDDCTYINYVQILDKFSNLPIKPLTGRMGPRN